MTTRIRVADHFPFVSTPPSDGEDREVAFELDTRDPLAGLSKGWVGALLMALRDKASRVSYRSWLPEPFTYTIGGNEIALAEPPAEFLPRFVDAAHALIAPGWLHRLKWRFGRRRVVAGVVDLDWGNGALTRWCGVCYRSGAECGAEFVHLGFPFEPATIPS